MAAHIFSESGQMQEVNIPDIFDVLEEGEDEGAVKYLLGFGTAGDEEGLVPVVDIPIQSLDPSKVVTVPASLNIMGTMQVGSTLVQSSMEGTMDHEGGSGTTPPIRKRDTSGAKAIFSCDCCGKAFTTKFNLKRHINMHCHKSKEAGVPVQGPPSANQPSKKYVQARLTRLRGDEPPGGKQPRLDDMGASLSSTSTGGVLMTSPGAAYQNTNSSSSSSSGNSSDIPTSHISPQFRTLIQTSVPSQASPTPSLNLSPASLPVQPLPEASLQIIQDLNNHSPTALMASSVGTAQVTTYTVPVTNAPLPPGSVTSYTLSPNQPIRPISVITSSSHVIPSTSNVNSVQNVVVSSPPTIQTSGHTQRVGLTTIPLLQTVQQAAKVIQIGNTSVPATFSVCVNVNPSSFQSSGSSLDSQVTTVPSNASVIITSSVVPQDLFDNSEPFSPEGLLLSSATGGEDVYAMGDEISSKTAKSFLGISGLNPDHKAAVTKCIEQVPKGWVRKVVVDEDGLASVLFFNANGKKFSCEVEVREYYLRLGYYLSPGAFDFENIHQSEVHMNQTQRQTKNMPPKRRLSSVGGANEDDRDGSEDRSSVTPEPGKKRKKMDPQQQMQLLFDFLRRYKREDGGELCEPFIRAPKRRTDPEYYDVVSDPIDMLRIQQKLKTDEYADMIELKADFDKLITNAHKFYADDSDEYEAASEVKDLLDRAVVKLEMGEDPVISLGNREESEDSELMEMLEELFAAVIQGTDPGDGNRQIHLAFRLLPSQKRYPEYYQVIKDPLDLKTIGTKIRDNVYESLMDLEDDLSLVFKNAMHFNEPGSLIYKDAKNLAKVVKTKKYELEVNKVARENRGSRTRRSNVKKHYSAELAELQYEDSESEESEEEDIDYEDPIWSLYGHVRHFETPSGVKLGEPFLTLPSKRELPDYYEVITEPISLNQIRKKLKSSEYSQISELADDLNLMFENCKSYNRPESRLYKEGAKLQKIMNAKLEELQLEEEDDEVVGEGSEANKLVIKSPRDPIRKRMRVLYNTVLNHKRNGVQIISMFMEKPSKKDYPDYYEIITSPMDMNTINMKIKGGQYKSEDDMITDMKLMFTNCRRYNEEGSDIYEDANVLEKVLVSKARDMGLTTSKGRKKKSYRASEKIKSLFETLRDHKDSKGRQLSLIFLKLPNPKEFPDYFEVIKNPVDFEKISSKMKQGVYNALEECLADFVAMFDNACKYNEPDSQIYKDALTMQSLATRTCRTLQDDDSSVPDVQAAVHDILTYLFISMYNHQDQDERCFSDSLAELPEFDDMEGKQTRALSLDLIKRRLDQGLYKRLDTFQRDIFAVMERARTLSRSDSQVFEDSVELQNFFIKVRDEACSNGDTLQSRALLYTINDLNSAVTALKIQKKSTETPEDENSRDAIKEEEEQGDSTSTATFNEQDYYVGEFVYVDGLEKGSDPFIYLIENIFTNKEGQQMMYGNQFFRPVETFHVSSRKFLENEVFRSEVHKSTPLSTIVGRCAVVPVKDYFRSKPENFEDKDVYVCESRYQSRGRSFKKMKIFWNIPDHINMVAREEPLEPKRIMSVFKERIEKHKEEIEEIDNMVRSLEEELPPNVKWANPDSSQVQENRTYYEQYTIPGPITLRRGDAVYVRSENGKNLIAQIDLMWTGEDGMAYFHGPWFVTPREIPHYAAHMFYKQESFLSTISDSNPLLSVVGRCCVLEGKDYKASRPTQYKESDVYICESVYDESKRIIRGHLDDGLKQYEFSGTVQVDEVYFFKHPIALQKEPNPNAPPTPTTANAVSNALSTPLKTNHHLSVMEVDNEDSLDAPPSVASSDTPTPTPTPASTKKVKGPSKKYVTPYIVYSSEIRKKITEEFKNCSFGDISRIVGEKKPAKLQKRNGYQIFSSQVWFRVKAEMGSSSFAEISREIGIQWKQLNETEKQIYEEKAKRQNEENALKFQMEQEKVEQERRRQEAATVAAAAIQQQQQRSAAAVLLNGQISAQSPGGVAQQVNTTTTVVQNGTALPLQPRNGINVQQVLSAARPTANTSGPLPKPVEPIFHTVPPRPQRLLHSEAYIRYIEGLSSDSQVMSNWEKQLNATKENTRTDEAKLPAHWLADNGEHGTSLEALWALRDFMMTDALGVMKML